MIDIVILDKNTKEVLAVTLHKYLKVDGHVNLREELWTMGNKFNKTISYRDRIKNLMKRESKLLSEYEQAYAVQSGMAVMGNIIEDKYIIEI